MPTLVGFGTFAALPEEHISEKISRRILSGDQGMIVWCFTRETGGLVHGGGRGHAARPGSFAHMHLGRT
jgi:hypothetical protein